MKGGPNMKKVMSLILAVVIIACMSCGDVLASCPTHGETYLYSYCSDVIASNNQISGICPNHGSDCYRILYSVYTWEVCQYPTCDHYLDDRPGHRATSTHSCLIVHSVGSNENICFWAN